MPVAAPPSVIDGPSADVAGLGGVSVARDGTGGLVYLKRVDGTPHVFVSVLSGGVFQPGQELDASLPGAASQPVIAAGNGGVLVVAFVNGGSLVAVTRSTSAAGFTAPQLLAAGASNPAIGISTLNKVYLAFTASGNGNHDVRCAYYHGGHWAFEPTPLDADPADDAGTGGGRPAVAVSGDGVAIVAWGEAGHVYTRRVWGISPSIVSERADIPALGGWSEVGADEPAIGTGGDSSYADVAYHEVLSNGSQQQSRVLVSRLHASQYDPVNQVDGLSTPGAGNADQPAVALGEYGRGFVTSEQADTGAIIASHAWTNGAIDDTFRVDTVPGAGRSYAAPGTAGLTSTLIAWQRDPGPLGSPEIRARYAPDGHNLGPEQVLSDPSRGPTDAADGLLATGDVAGDAAVVWVQGPADQREIDVAQMYQPPGAVVPVPGLRYVNSAQPMLSWIGARALWGPITYVITVDGARTGQTTADALQVPVRLPDGPHSWQVTAVNRAGGSSTTRPTRIWVDTVRPAVAFAVAGGQHQVGRAVHVAVTETDAPPPEPPADASGIASATISWGDRTHVHVGRHNSHVYRRAGRYTITVRVSDRAGNTTVVRRTIRVLAPSNSSGAAKPGRHK